MEVPWAGGGNGPLDQHIDVQRAGDDPGEGCRCALFFEDRKPEHNARLVGHQGHWRRSQRQTQIADLLVQLLTSWQGGEVEVNQFWLFAFGSGKVDYTLCVDVIDHVIAGFAFDEPGRLDHETRRAVLWFCLVRPFRCQERQVVEPFVQEILDA